MLIDKFEIFLALLAGLILLVMGIVMRFTLPAILLRLLIVLAAFYIIGLIVKTYLRKRIFFTAETKEDSDEGHAEGEEALVDGAGGGTENQPTL
jgi:phage shock protein PspC (stress-responsive transcriptional regulator)